jgi:hypothetical protein
MKNGSFSGKARSSGPQGHPVQPYQESRFFFFPIIVRPHVSLNTGDLLSAQKEKRVILLLTFSPQRDRIFFFLKPGVRQDRDPYLRKPFSNIQIQIIFPLPSQAQALQQSICNKFSEKCDNR